MTDKMNTEIMIKVFDLINTNNYYSIIDENYKYEEGDADVDWFELFDEIVNCKTITDMVHNVDDDGDGYIEVDYVDDGKDCMFIIEYNDDEYQNEINRLDNENQKLKKILHKACEMDDTLKIGIFEEEKNKSIDNLETLNFNLKKMVMFVLKQRPHFNSKIDVK